MHPHMILSIFRKDLRDAIRDSRVLVAIIVPIALGIFYNFIFDEPVETVPTATVAYTADGETTLLDTLEAVVGESVDVTFEQFDDAEAVRQAVLDDDADMGLIIPSGFEEAVEAGQVPELTVILPEDAGVSTDYLVASIDPTLRQIAGQQPPAMLQVEQIGDEEDDGLIGTLAIFDELGLAGYFVLVAAVMLIAMISMLALPVILAEEAEKKTLDALVLVASYLDVIIAKALVGLVYIGVSLALLLALTQLSPQNLPLFIAAVLMLSIALIAFGLLLGGLFRNANQLNTWSGFLLIPVIAPAFMVGLPLPDIADTILTFIPTSQAVRLLVNGLTGTELFPDVWLSFLVLTAWAVIAFLLLGWSLSRREA